MKLHSAPMEVASRKLPMQNPASMGAEDLPLLEGDAVVIGRMEVEALAKRQGD